MEDEVKSCRLKCKEQHNGLSLKVKMATEKLETPHVDEILKQEFMEPLGLSNRKLASEIGVDTMTISRLVNAKSSLSINLARRLGAYFKGSSAEYWLTLNSTCELRRACLADNGKIEREIGSRRSAYEKAKF